MSKPIYVRLRDCERHLGVDIETIRQKIHIDYLPVYVDVDAQYAVPHPIPVSSCKQSRTDRCDEGWLLIVDGKEYYRGPGYCLPTFWKVWNDKASESCDGGLMELCRTANKRVPIAHIGVDPEWRELPGSRFLKLVSPLMVTLDDLYVRAEDVEGRKNVIRQKAGKSGARENARVADERAKIVCTMHKDIRNQYPAKNDGEIFTVIRTRANKGKSDAEKFIANAANITLKRYLRRQLQNNDL